MWRDDEEEVRLSNELEAHYDEWGLRGAGESTVWIPPGSTPHPDLVDWCEQHGFDIKEYEPER